jgi:hypothetical protein
MIGSDFPRTPWKKQLFTPRSHSALAFELARWLSRSFQLFPHAGQKLITRSNTPSKSQSKATNKLLTSYKREEKQGRSREEAVILARARKPA